MIIVTGGAGFIGSAVIWKLNQMGIEDVLVVDDLNRSEKWKNLVKRKFNDYHRFRIKQELSKTNKTKTN